MAASFPESSGRRTAPRGAMALGLALSLLCGPPVAAQQQAITLDAESSDFDRRNERLVFREVRVQQGELAISARHAESKDLDFSRGSWTFRGEVRISGPMGQIESEHATVSFVDHRLSRATADGEPAHFSRSMPGPDGRQVTGTANRIVFDMSRGELELSGSAALRDGLREVSGGRLVYRIAEDRLIASSDDDGAERVRIVISPPEQEGPAPAPPEESPPEGEPTP